MTSSIKWKKFSPETLQLLFTAVDEDDIVNQDATLPSVIDFQCTLENIHDNYALCLQFWEDGFDRTELLGLVRQLAKGNGFTEAERMQYKYIRARYKHLRFAQRLYTKKHASSSLFRQTTVFLGHFQDAFKNRNKKNISRFSRVLFMYLSLPFWKLVHYGLRHPELDTVEGFIADRQEQIRTLRTLIAKPMLTGTEFHDVRKIISQQVSYYDTLRSIDPSNQDAYKISRFLSNINGLMGDKHDVMVADKLSGRRPYEEPALLDTNIREPLEQLLERCPV